MRLMKAVIDAKARGLLFQHVGVSPLQEGDDPEQTLTGSYIPSIRADFQIIRAEFKQS